MNELLALLGTLAVLSGARLNWSTKLPTQNGYDRTKYAGGLVMIALGAALIMVVVR